MRVTTAQQTVRDKEEAPTRRPHAENWKVSVSEQGKWEKKAVVREWEA